MNALTPLKARWNTLAGREKIWVGAAMLVVAIAMVWLIAVAPALRTLRTAEQQQRTLDAQLTQVMMLQGQARALQAQPKQNRDEALRQLDLSVRQRLGESTRTLISGDRVTVTLSGIAPDALVQWLAQARVNARALPGEAHLSRNSRGLWEGTLVLALPPR